MNKTSYSCNSSKRPDGYRVLYKSRNNRYDESTQLRHSNYLNQDLNKVNDSLKAISKSNKDGMKDYVRNRMKTEYSQKFRPSKQNERKVNTPILKISQTTQPQNIKPTLQKLKPQTQDIELKSQTKHLPAQPKTKNPLQMLQSLQKRISSLLHQRLQQCQSFKTQRNQIVEGQLYNLIQKIKDVKELSNNPEQIQADLEYYNRKIKMIETIMAQSMTQSEILKKDLLSKLSNKLKHKRLNTQTSISYNRYSAYKSDTKFEPQVITKKSINQHSYAVPNRQAYNIYKYKNVFFNADRHKQPLPRSSYNRQFLNQVPNPDKEYLPMNNQFMGGRSLSSKLLSTSYQQNFGPKSAEKINIKELSACRDKIKNIAIVFHQRTKSKANQPIFYNVEKLNKMQFKPEKTNIVMPQKAKTNMMPKTYLLSESRRQYKGNSYTNIKSQIKHSFLNKLRYEFKNNVHA